MNKITVQNLPLNPNYMLRSDSRLLPLHLKASDLKPFTIIVCQSKVLAEAYDAMVVEIGPGKLRVLDRFGAYRTVKFGDVLDITRRPVMIDDEGVDSLFPFETAVVAAASPNELLRRLRDPMYPCVLCRAEDGWRLTNLGLSDNSFRVPDETAYAVGLNPEVYHTEVSIRNVKSDGIVSRLNSSIGESIVWTPESLAAFIEEDPKSRLIDLSYEYVEATLVIDTKLNGAGFTNWSIDRDDAEEMGNTPDFAASNVKEPDAPPRNIVAHRSHPSLDYACEFKRVKIPHPFAKKSAPKKPAPKKAAKSAKKVAAKKAPAANKSTKKIYSAKMKIG